MPWGGGGGNARKSNPLPTRSTFPLTGSNSVRGLAGVRLNSSADRKCRCGCGGRHRWQSGSGNQLPLESGLSLSERRNGGGYYRVHAFFYDLT